LRQQIFVPELTEIQARNYDRHKPLRFTYTPAGRLHTREWARSTPQNQRLTTTYGYAAGGSLETIDYNDDTPDVTLQTDALGRRKSTTNTLSTTVYGYDDDGTLALETDITM
jgi:hypothetical protein